MPPPTSKSTSSLSSDGEAPASNNLWIGNLSPEVTDSELTALFEKHGPVDSITNYASRSYGFVYYKKIEDAKSAKEKLQGTILHGNPIKIEFAKPAKPCKSLWVAGISQSVSKEELEEEFTRFGKIQEFKFLRDRNTAYVDFSRLEDASQALKNMNGRRIGGDQIRVDFLRSQPSRREQLPDFRDAREGHFPNRSIGPPDTRWMAQESIQVGSKRHQFQSPGGRRGDGQPSKVLWISYPPSVQIDEDMLHNAMILFGEIERIKTFEDRNYAFVQFRSVDEARLAKEGLQGKLFSDPRISIEYSNSELAPNKDYLGNYPGTKGTRPDTYLNDVPFRHGQMDIISHDSGVLPPRGAPGPDGIMRPLGPQGNFDLQGGHHAHLGGPNWRRSSPAPGLLSSPSASLNLPNRSASSAWDVYDASQLQRESKRSRVEGTLQAHNSSFSARITDDQGLGLDEPYGLRTYAGSTDPLSNFEGRSHLSPVGMQISVGGLGKRIPEPDYVWRGIIAKGGSLICHARCVPIGEGISSEIPEVVNCTARTGLDLLTKHYADAVGFSIAFFLPDSEADFASYTEFLRYLGARNRAGVAKFDDGTTLFLVPPSDFLTNVLKVTGPERLYGVVLEFPQAASASSNIPPSLVQPQYVDAQQQASSLTGYNEIAQEEIGIQMGYNKVVPEDMKPPLKMLGSSLNSTPPINNAAVSQAGLKLTPDLIATLASIYQGNSKSSGSESSSVQSASTTLGPALNITPAPDKGLPQGWQHERQVPEQAGYVTQQFNSQFHSQAQFIPQVHAYPVVSNTLNLPAQGALGYSQIQDRGFNMQPQGAVSSRPIASATPSQGQVSALSNVDQQHQLGMPHDPLKGHGMAQGTDALRLYGSSVLHQPTNLVTLGSEINGPNVLQHASMPQTTEADVRNQVQEHHSALQGAGQDTSETEEEKNRRYQSTLLFAVNLLNRVQQPPGTQAGQGSGS
ncbi:unnamed protein product [Coffea canephora]|uniref:RRM domain-containing protein n=2 Tax=Coffea TaxID=13442 RepID=A0A068U798_COFCA|nr:flowering time control protein FPA-like [Coffea arabica]XP_027117517.1 flowering time control protein FPA-like [Coffea arabica]XP_027117518.1 flowering time control protein FPA-like [Coffea arabica]CDP03488.1 unnamed protein product [Coffea canephora]